MNLELNGKKALVMGSSEGIGLAIAKSLLAEGATVCLNARNEEKLAMRSKEIGAHAFIPGDLTLPGEGKRITARASSQLQGLDILVANTGGPPKKNFMDVSGEDWQRDFQSLWMSVVESLQECLPPMSEAGFGRILVVSSIAAKEPLPGLTTSNGFRAGLAGLMKSIANECAYSGVTLNLLLPGYTNTDRIKNLNLSQEWIEKTVPAGRLGRPEELGELAAFLASPKAGYITGQSIAVDGGVLAGH